MSETPGDRLKRLMKAAKLDNQMVAEAADVHVKTVSYWRSGKQRPEEPQAIAIVELLKRHGVAISVAYFRYGTTLPDAGAPTVPERPDDEMQLLKLQVRELVAIYNKRLAQRAPRRELERLRRSLASAVRTIIEVGVVDSDHLEHAVDVFVGSLVPPVPARGEPQGGAAKSHIKEV